MIREGGVGRRVREERGREGKGEGGEKGKEGWEGKGGWEVKGGG